MKEKPIPLPPPTNKEDKVIVEKEIRFLDNGVPVVQPHALDLEQVILGALLIDAKTKEYIRLLEAEVFFDKKHQRIFKAIQTLDDSGEAIDILTTSNELKRKGMIDIAGGDYYLVQLTQMVSSGAHIDFHIRIVLQKYVLRELVYMSRNTMFKSLHRDPDIFDLIEGIENKIASIENIAMRKVNDDSNDADADLMRKVELQRQGISPGYPTGIFDFDQWRGGLQPRWLITLAARPGMGKTSAIISIIVHMVFDNGIPVSFFSLEMSAIDLKYKIAARLTEIPFQLINSGRLDDEQLEKVRQSLKAIDNSSLTIIDNIKNLDKIVSESRKMARDGIKVFFLDYVQLVELTRQTDNETSKLTTITRTLKALTNELNVPFVQLAQLSREPDKRPGHRPQLSDLKQSGSIEEDSDMVIFILRPEYYNKEKSKVPVPPDQLNPEYIGEWIVAKGRSTGTRDFDIYIDFSQMKLESLSGLPF